MNPLDPTILAYGLLATFILFTLAAFFTRATWRRIGGVLLSAIPVIFIVMFYDRVAAQLGLWRYPAVTIGNAPLTWYIAAALFYGATLGLVGWRVIRRWGWSGLWVFIVALAAFGVTRDYLYSASTGLIRFGPGIVPVIADFLAYASPALLVQALMVWIVGGPREDPLARVRQPQQNAHFQ